MYALNNHVTSHHRCLSDLITSINLNISKEIMQNFLILFCDIYAALLLIGVGMVVTLPLSAPSMVDQAVAVYNIIQFSCILS